MTLYPIEYDIGNDVAFLCMHLFPVDGSPLRRTILQHHQSQSKILPAGGREHIYATCSLGGSGSGQGVAHLVCSNDIVNLYKLSLRCLDVLRKRLVWVSNYNW